MSLFVSIIKMIFSNRPEGSSRELSSIAGVW